MEKMREAIGPVPAIFGSGWKVIVLKQKYGGLILLCRSSISRTTISGRRMRFNAM